MPLTVYSKEQDERNNKGVWKDFEGSQLRIARWLNVNFISNFLAESKDAIPDQEKGGVTDEDIENGINRMEKYNLLCKAMAGPILTDWKNVKNEETGEDVPFSPEFAEILLRNNLRVHNFVKTTSMSMDENQSNKEETVSGE